MACVACQAGGACDCGTGGACNVDGPGFGGGGALPRSPVVRNVLIARIPTSTVFVAGRQITLDLTLINQPDEKGRKPHIATLKMLATPRFDTVTAQMTAAYPGDDILGLVNNVQIKDSGNWQYAAGLDARAFRDDMIMRQARLLRADPADIPDADATDLEVPCCWYWPFTLNGDHGVKYQGAIPVADLVAAGSDAVSFNLATTLPGAPAGVTLDDFEGETFAEVWATVVYLPNVTRQFWQLETYEIDNTNGVLRHCDRWHEYAAIRYFREDTGGQALDDIVGLSAQANGQTIVQSINSAIGEILEQSRSWLEADPDADVSEIQDANGNATFAILTGQHRKAVPSSPYGAVTFSINSLADHANTVRFLHRTIGVPGQGIINSTLKANCLPKGTRFVAKVGGLVVTPSSAPGATIIAVTPGAVADQVRANDVLI